MSAPSYCWATSRRAVPPLPVRPIGRLGPGASGRSQGAHCGPKEHKPNPKTHLDCSFGMKLAVIKTNYSDLDALMPLEIVKDYPNKGQFRFEIRGPVACRSACSSEEETMTKPRPKKRLNMLEYLKPIIIECVQPALRPGATNIDDLVGAASLNSSTSRTLPGG